MTEGRGGHPAREPGERREGDAGAPDLGPTEDYTPFGERFANLDTGPDGIDATLPLESEGDTQRTVGLPPLADGKPAPLIPGVTLESVIGQGGQGIVYRGRQSYLDRDVAVKVLASGAGSCFADRFQREAKILAGMHHRFIVGCYSAGMTEDGQCFIVMEFVDGPDLAGWIRNHGALEPGHALTLVRDVAVALQHAQTVNVIHRDVKPQNVLLEPVEPVGKGTFAFRAKLADLGLARATGDGELRTMLTVPGAVMGTPATMSLEQIDDPDTVDYRTDIYGLGCVLYHALAGKAAYAGLRPSQVFKKKAQEPPPAIRQDVPGLPKSIAALVRAMMDADRTKRPQSYQELIERIESELALLAGSHGASSGRRPGIFLGVGLLAVAAVAVGLVLSTRTPAESEPPPARLQRAVDDASAVPDEETSSPVEPVGHGNEGDPVATVEPSTDSNGAPQGDSELDPAGGTGSNPEVAGEPEPAPKPVVPEVTLGPELRTGEVLRPFEAWDDVSNMLVGWERVGLWSAYDSDPSVPKVSTDEESESVATHVLPAGSWSLTGEVSVGNPFGWDWDRGGPVHGDVRVGFEENRALRLRLTWSVSEGEGEAVWRLVEFDGEGWETSSPDLGLDPQPFSKKREWVSFHLDFDGSTLDLRIGDDQPSSSHDLESLDLRGPASTLSLVGHGGVRWRDFELRGI